MHQLTNSLDRQGFGNFCQASHNHLVQTDSQVNASLQKPELTYTDICKEWLNRFTRWLASSHKPKKKEGVILRFLSIAHLRSTFLDQTCVGCQQWKICVTPHANFSSTNAEHKLKPCIDLQICLGRAWHFSLNINILQPLLPERSRQENRL